MNTYKLQVKDEQGIWKAGYAGDFLTLHEAQNARRNFKEETRILQSQVLPTTKGLSDIQSSDRWSLF